MAKPPKKGHHQGQKNPAKEYKQLAQEKRAAEVQTQTISFRREVPVAPTQETDAVTAKTGAETQTLQQQRAKYALEQVKRALVPPANEKEFRSYAASFPAMVQMNGLGQAAAFYCSQGDTYQTLYKILSNWLTQPMQPYAGDADLLAGITSRDMHSYRIAQAEALLLLDWVKRFAKAFVRDQ